MYSPENPNNYAHILTLVTFDHDVSGEPRDSDGKWTDGGAGAKSPKLKQMESRLKDLRALDESISNETDHSGDWHQRLLDARNEANALEYGGIPTQRRKDAAALKKAMSQAAPSQAAPQAATSSVQGNNLLNHPNITERTFNGEKYIFANGLAKQSEINALADSFNHFDKLNPVEQDAVKKYTGTKLNKEVNEHLRDGGSVSEKGKAVISGLDSAIDKSTLDKNTMLTRVASFSPEAIAKMTPGSVYEDKGFMSTSVTPLAGPFNLTWSIAAKAGSHALAVGTSSAKPKEGEVILPRNSRLKISKVELIKAANPYVSDHYHVHAELI